MKLEVDDSAYKGKESQLIKVKAWNRDFEIEEVEVIVKGRDGVVLEKGNALSGMVYDWNYWSTTNVTDQKGIEIFVRIKERTGNVVERRFLKSV